MSEPLPLDDDTVRPAMNGQAKDHDGVPYCRRHHCRMRARSSASKSKGKDYYACPVDDCDERSVRIRAVERIVPPNPQPCPRCSTESRPVYCERNEKRSTASGVVLVCPKCGFNAGMFVVPQLEAARLNRPAAVSSPDAIGDR